MLPRILAGVLLAVILYFIGIVFGLNGKTWDWWQDAAWGAAVLTVIATPLVSEAGDRMQRCLVRFRGLMFAMGLAGVAVLIATLAVMGNRFNDSYEGSLAWPKALACVGVVGYVVALVAVCFLSSASGRRPQESNFAEKRSA